MLTVTGTSAEGLLCAPLVDLDVYYVNADLWGAWSSVDPIGAMLHGSLLPTELLPLREALGYGTTDDVITLDILGDPPFRRKYSEGIDEWRFGLGLFPLAVPSLPGARAEQEIQHSSYSGTAVSSSSSLPHVMGTFDPLPDYLGVNSPYGFSEDRVVNTMEYDGTWSLGTRTSPVFPRVRYLRSVLEALSAHGDTWRRVDSYPGFPRAIVIKVVDWSENGSSLSIRFSGEFRLWAFSVDPYVHPDDSYAYIAFTTDITLSRVMRTYDDFPGTYGVYPLVSSYRLDHSTVLASLNSHEYPYSVPFQFADLAGMSSGGSYLLQNIVMKFIDIPGKLISQVDDGFHTHYRTSTVTRHFDDFIHSIHSDFGNLLPGLFYSSADAVTKHVDIISSNNLENLASLSSLASLIPDIGKFISAITQAKSGKLLSAGATLLDLFTEVQLQLDFGVRPGISDVQALSDGFDAVVQRFRDQGIWGERTLYGKFLYELPAGSLGREKTSVVYRSKVRVTFNNTSLLATLVRGKSVGLLPTFSSLWDLVPFSFVVDWGFNIGDRLADAEAQAFMLLLPCHGSVHSIQLFTPLDLNELDDLEIEPNSFSLEAAPGFRYYIRMPSRRLPRLHGNSKYDFRAAAGPSSLLTAGALVTQLIK